MDVFETFMKLSTNARYQALHVSGKKPIKIIGHHARLRDQICQSYPIYACTRANHGRYSSSTLLRKRNLTGTKGRAYGTIYKICGDNHTMEVRLSCSRCFRGRNLHPRVSVLGTLPSISFFLPNKNIWIFSKLKKMLCTLLLCNKTYRSLCSFKTEKTSIYFSIELNLREISFVAYVHALICAR